MCRKKYLLLSESIKKQYLGNMIGINYSVFLLKINCHVLTLVVSERNRKKVFFKYLLRNSSLLFFGMEIHYFKNRIFFFNLIMLLTVYTNFWD